MIEVVEALKTIKTNISPIEIIDLEVRNSVGYILAEDCHSPLSFPPFNQSAMDGYALFYEDTDNTTEFNVIDEIKAGDDASQITLHYSEACRIFTGAMVPNNTYCVVKQEDVVVENGKIRVTKQLVKGENIRLEGEQIIKGELAVKSRTPLNPGSIGFLSTLGFQKVKVYKKPKIAIIATGNELIEVGNELKMGKIYESNNSTLFSALSQFGFDATCKVVEDSYEKINEEISLSIADNDMVLITGGISVGDYDFVGRVLKDQGVCECFYKVKQKPGKPLFFGKKKETVIFGLPGNPASVLTNFYIYVLDALQLMTGRKEGYLKQRFFKLNADYEKSTLLTVFLKGKVVDGIVEILPFQSSAMLSSFIDANCLIKLDGGISKFTKDQEVEVYLLE